MDLGQVLQLAAVLVGGGGFLGSLLLLPKIRAEANKLNAEAGVLLIPHLQREIKRLDAEIKTLRSEAKAEKNELERENKRLRGEVRRLTRRVSGLESILKLHPVTPEMQRLLDELDRRTGGEK
jgi:hypothetical protein